MNRIRRGAVLIITVGLLALIATLFLAFVARVRLEGAAAQQVSRRCQASIMLVAACTYIQETSRLGWEVDAAHREAFGWVDVRSGQVGPLVNLGHEAPRPVFPVAAGGAADGSDVLRVDTDGDGVPDRPQWPAVGSFCRAPMHRWTRPPWAISTDVAPNAVETDPLSPRFGHPLLNRPDPLPLAADWAGFRGGDARPEPLSQGRAWFRLYRDGPATFIVTVGAGATEGFRSWGEVVAAHATGRFGGDASDSSWFDLLRDEELRLWYRVEWSPAVGGGEWRLFAQNGAHEEWTEQPRWRSLGSIPFPGAHGVNHGGTIQWVQRLRSPPLNW